MKAQLIAVLTLTLLMSACGQETTPEVVVEPNLKVLIVENCAIVAQAVDSYQAQHDSYPASVNDFISLLPNGTLLTNPYTGVASEPSDGWAESQGQIGYRPVVIGAIVGCHITGFGDSEIIRHLVVPHDFDALVIANCYTVVDAAERYKVLHGTYPDDAVYLKALLPSGEWLTNPYSMTANLPQSGRAVVPGDTGYEPIVDLDTDEAIGYSVSGFGETQMITEILYWPDMP